MSNQNGKVILGISGGVDSSVAALLLSDAGYEVTGVYIKIPGAPDRSEDARLLAASLGVGFSAVDAGDLFRRVVIDDFVREYASGRTPSPCILCNPGVKFRILAETANLHDAELIATGHYARTAPLQSGGTALLRGSDRRKDQSYMLYRLPQDILARLILPLGRLTKDKVRETAAGRSVPSANAPDSQEICFLPDGRYPEFVESKLGRPLPPGDFVDLEGKVLGSHRGISRYTVGQRKGINNLLFDPNPDPPLFVTGIDAGTNRVHLGPDSALYKMEIRLERPVFIPDPPPSGIPLRCTAKVRFSQTETPASAIFNEDDSSVLVAFEEPVRAPSPGQSCVLYDGDHVVGGGIIAG